MWLKELDSFSKVPSFFQQALKNKKYKDLLLQVLSGSPDYEKSTTNNVVAEKWKNEHKVASEMNFKILG